MFQRTPVLNTVPPFTPAQQALSDATIRYWTDFARLGTPNAWGQRYWPVVRTGRLLSLDPAGLRTLSLSTYGAEHHCALWRSLPTTDAV